MTANEQHEIASIKAFFEDRNRALLLGEQDGWWEALFPVKGYPSAPPFATGRTPIEAARNALMLWYDRPDLGAHEAPHGV